MPMTGPVELVPGEFVLFVSQGPSEEQQSQFLDILKETWQLVPSADRRTILDYYRGIYYSHPPVVFGARLNDQWPIAMNEGEEGDFMLWFDSLRILNLPGGKTSTILVIAEELAHALMTAIHHPTHIAAPPNDNPASAEHRAWDKAREDAMKEKLYSWRFVNRTEHENLIEWVGKTKGGLKKEVDGQMHSSSIVTD
jgi:hypothetical protein